jgi:hypothetical protein
MSTAVGIPHADHVAPSIRKVGNHFATSGSRSVGVVRSRTQTMELVLFCLMVNRKVSQEIRYFSWSLDFHYGAHKCQPLDPKLKNRSVVYTVTPLWFYSRLSPGCGLLYWGVSIAVFFTLTTSFIFYTSLHPSLPDPINVKRFTHQNSLRLCILPSVV